MARIALSVLTLPTRAGISIADAALTAANTDGHMFVNDGRTVLILQNTNGAIRTVTVQTPIAVDGLAVADLSITVPALTGRVITPPFPVTVYNQSNGMVFVDYSGVSQTLVAAVRIPWEVLL